MDDLGRAKIQLAAAQENERARSVSGTVAHVVAALDFMISYLVAQRGTAPTGREVAERFDAAGVPGIPYRRTGPSGTPLLVDAGRACALADAVRVVLARYASKADSFSDLRAALATFESNGPGTWPIIVYTVQPGDTLTALARKFNLYTSTGMLDVTRLARVNRIVDHDHIEEGWDLIIPAP